MASRCLRMLERSFFLLIVSGRLALRLLAPCAGSVGSYAGGRLSLGHSLLLNYQTLVLSFV